MGGEWEVSLDMTPRQKGQKHTSATTKKKGAKAGDNTAISRVGRAGAVLAAARHDVRVDRLLVPVLRGLPPPTQHLARNRSAILNRSLWSNA